MTTIEDFKYAKYRWAFLKNGYVKIPNAVSKEIVELYKAFIDLSWSRNLRNPESSHYLTGPIHSVGSNVMDDALLLHCKYMAEKVFDVDNLVPTYAYSREYFRGSELKVHKDRDQCQFSISLTMYRRGEGSAKIWFSEQEDMSNPKGIELNEGDALIFNGGTHYAGSKWHWRDPLEIDSLFQLFLHYVAPENIHLAEYSYPLPNYRSR